MRETIDARGLRCPVPTLKLQRAIGAAPAATVISLIADDPMARLDIAHFAAEAGHQLLALTERDGVVIATVRKRT